MKKLLFILLAFAGTAQAQSPASNGVDNWSQMWNTSSTYYGTVTTSNLGTQKDTTSGTTALYLTTSTWNGSTFAAMPVNGDGYGELFVRVKKVTGTDTITLTPVVSDDGVTYSALTGQTPIVLTPTSLTVAVGCSFQFANKPARYLGIKAVGNTGTTIMVQASYNFTKRR